MIYFTISVLLGVIALLAWLVEEQGRSVRHLEELAHRDRVDSRARFLEVVRESRDEYRALTESYIRQEGKVFVTPVSRFDDRIPRTPDPPKHAFKMRPPPPMTENSPPPSIGTIPQKKDR